MSERDMSVEAIRLRAETWEKHYGGDEPGDGSPDLLATDRAELLRLLDEARAENRRLETSHAAIERTEADLTRQLLDCRDERETLRDQLAGLGWQRPEIAPPRDVEWYMVLVQWPGGSVTEDYAYYCDGDDLFPAAWGILSETTLLAWLAKPPRPEWAKGERNE